MQYKHLIIVLNKIFFSFLRLSYIFQILNYILIEIQHFSHISIIFKIILYFQKLIPSCMISQQSVSDLKKLYKLILKKIKLFFLILSQYKIESICFVLFIYLLIYNNLSNIFIY